MLCVMFKLLNLNCGTRMYGRKTVGVTPTNESIVVSHSITSGHEIKSTICCIKTSDYDELLRPRLHTWTNFTKKLVCLEQIIHKNIF